jgi:hypothetical protein
MIFFIKILNSFGNEGSSYIFYKFFFAPSFVSYKKGALDSQPQVIKFTSCLPMVGGSLRVSSTTKTGHHDIAEILLKVALNTIKLIEPPRSLKIKNEFTCFKEFLHSEPLNDQD